LPEAERIARESLEAERRVMGSDHSDTLVTENMVGQVLREEHRYPEAELVMLDTLARRTKAFGAKHPDVAETEYNLAALYALEGKKDDAFLHLNRSLENSPKPELYKEILEDTDLSSLRSDPRFAEFVAKTKKLSETPAK
jgi:hypothetical protein